MPPQEVLVYPDPLLKQPAATISDPLDVACQALVADLLDTMTASGHSVGLAAPQIGRLQRAAVVDVSATKLGRDNNHGRLILLNPELVEQEGETTMREGCMSVPDYTGNVTRYAEIVVQYTTPEAKERVIRATGFEAVAIQHELDHLDGRLFLDRVANRKTDLFRRKKYR